jgi:hypothetical protein
MALLGFVFELYLGGAWVDITDYVRHQRVNIQRGTLDESPKLTPAKAALTLDSTDDRFNPRNPHGPYHGLLVRNTPLRISCEGAVSDRYRFYGEVFTFAPRWDTKGGNRWVKVEANGALRRIIKNAVTPHSYYRSWLNTRTSAPIPLYHWALEEGPDAEAAWPDIGQGSAIILPNTVESPAAQGRSFGKAQMNDWHPNGVLIPNLNTMWFPCDMRGSTSAGWEVTGILTHTANETVTQIEINCGSLVWYIQMYTVSPAYNSSNAMLINPNGTVDFVSTALLAMKDVGPVWFAFRASLSAGVITARFTWAPVERAANTLGVGTATQTITSPTQVYPRYVGVSSVANTPDNGSVTSATGLKDLAVAECAIGTSGIGLSYTATKGGRAEDTDERFTRMCDEQGINNTASVFGSTWMGRQYLNSFEEHLQEILASGRHSGIVESRTDNALALLGLAPNRGAIDLTEIIPELEPSEDDRGTANIIELTNADGGQATITRATGEMSTEDIGPFEAKVETNNYYWSEAMALAGLRLARGTWPGPRFTNITVSAQLNPARYAFYRSIDVGDFLSLTGMDAHGYYEPLLFRVLGIQEAISQEDHQFTFTVRPGQHEWNLWTLETHRVDIADSTVAVASSGATVDVNVPTAKWSLTAVPYDVIVAGEQMTVTAVTNLTATTQRLTVTRSLNGVVKTVPVGAEVHAYPDFYIQAVQ